MPINSYGNQMSAEDIAQGRHRAFIGGMWDEIGPLQARFLQSQGLQPSDRLLDMGCGALRGGLHFMRYLEPGRYYGVDINNSLLQAGAREIELAGLQDRRANLAWSDDFNATHFGVSFDYGIALSLFTHLTHDLIERCLLQLSKVMHGSFYATYFEAPSDNHLSDIHHPLGEITTHYSRDPYHISFKELEELASRSGMKAERIGEWGHPRSQYIAVFRPA